MMNGLNTIVVKIIVDKHEILYLFVQEICL